MLFVMGDFEKDTRTHHIHAVKWDGTEWKNDINFRDYLNCHPDKTMIYYACKKKLALQFPDDRRSYTEGKQECIECLQTDKFYNVKFEEKGRPTIPDFIKANELDIYKLELPDAGAVENISLKKNSDSPIVISSKDDVENILLSRRIMEYIQSQKRIMI